MRNRDCIWDWERVSNLRVWGSVEGLYSMMSKSDPISRKFLILSFWPRQSGQSLGVVAGKSVFVVIRFSMLRIVWIVDWIRGCWSRRKAEITSEMEPNWGKRLFWGVLKRV